VPASERRTRRAGRHPIQDRGGEWSARSAGLLQPISRSATSANTDLPTRDGVMRPSARR